MRNFLIAVILASGSAAVLTPGGAFAHVLKVDGHIGAVLHTDPNDEPIAGTTTPIFLAFKNDATEFDVSHYTVALSISNGSDHRVQAIPITSAHATSHNTLTFSYVFPKEDVYTLVVSGIPNASSTPNDPPFTLAYDVRVDQQVAVTGDYASFLQIHSLHAIIVGIGILIGVVITVRDARITKKQTQGVQELV